MDLFQITGEADRYHEFRPRYHSMPFEWILAENNARYESALDVACGTGHSAEAMKIIADGIIGVDCSEEMLRVAREFSCLSFVRADAKALPFADNTFDFINVSMGFHWLKQDDFLKEAKRVLSPTGQLCINSVTFGGQISEDEDEQARHECLFEDYLPPVKRSKGYPNEELRCRHGLTLDRDFEFSTHCTLGVSEFINLVMTWSNYQILSSADKEKVVRLMREAYGEIFSGEMRTLKFNGKARLYSFGSYVDSDLQRMPQG